MDALPAFAQLQLRFVDHVQWRYELIRPVVLLENRTATQRATETQTHPEGSVAKLGFGGKIRKSDLGKSMACEFQLSCFR